MGKKEKLRLLAFFQKKKRPDRAIELQSQWIHEWVLQFQFNILHTYVKSDMKKVVSAYAFWTIP